MACNSFAGVYYVCKKKKTNKDKIVTLSTVSQIQILPMFSETFSKELNAALVFTARNSAS